jgi:predicted TIM-barrel fold metal-dependent hydrolase
LPVLQQLPSAQRKKVLGQNAREVLRRVRST